MIIYKELHNQLMNCKNITVIHGSAGNGKNYFIKEFAQNTRGRCLLLAPTGFTRVRSHNVKV
jgi:tRNA A37 threonylcarbamoyladenosine biosynthesis protein TsaE